MRKRKREKKAKNDKKNLISKSDLMHSIEDEYIRRFISISTRFLLKRPNVTIDFTTFFIDIP